MYQKGRLEWTGERFVPWANGAQIYYEHLHRYAYAYRLVDKKRVLDLGSGEGYGTAMLAERAEKAIGIEIDETAVYHAQRKYVNGKLEFIRGSILNVPLKANTWDAIVCFEVLEHIKEHDKFMAEAKRLLKGDGLLMVSTPNRAIYTDQPNYHNPFHTKELYFDEFVDLLKRYFKYVRIYGQRVYAGSNMWSMHQSKSSGYVETVVQKGDMGFYLTSRDKKEPVYLVAMAADTELGPFLSVTDSWLTDVSNVFFNDYERQLQNKDTQIHSLDSQILNLGSQMQLIEGSIPMQLVNRYQGFIERLLRPGTRRRCYYELILAGIRVILTEGWGSLFRKLKARLINRVKVRGELVNYIREGSVTILVLLFILVVFLQDTYNAIIWHRRRSLKSML